MTVIAGFIVKQPWNNQHQYVNNKSISHIMYIAAQYSEFMINIGNKKVETDRKYYTSSLPDWFITLVIHISSSLTKNTSIIMILNKKWLVNDNDQLLKCFRWTMSKVYHCKVRWFESTSNVQWYHIIHDKYFVLIKKVKQMFF